MNHHGGSHGPIQLVSFSTVEGPAVQSGRRLSELAEAMDVVHQFRKGQLVRWKPGLQNRAAPAYHEVAVVRQVLAVPLFDQCEQAKCSGTPLFAEPLTVVLAILGSDGEFLEYHYDARRFEPVED